MNLTGPQRADLAIQRRSEQNRAERRREQAEYRRAEDAELQAYIDRPERNVPTVDDSGFNVDDSSTWGYGMNLQPLSKTELEQMQRARDARPLGPNARRIIQHLQGMQEVQRVNEKRDS